MSASNTELSLRESPFPENLFPTEISTETPTPLHTNRAQRTISGDILPPEI